MKFEIITLIDITETRAKFDKSNSAWHQQQNFITVLSTIGIRSNPVIETTSTYTIEAVKGQGFGTVFKGEQKIWRLEFEFESEAAHSIEFLIEDFDIVPIIAGLNETVKLKNSVFETKSSAYRNTMFKYYD